MSEADSILSGITNSRQNAQATAVGAIDDDPEQAARAIELEKSTGVPSAAIYGDVDGFEAQHKAALAGEIVKNNSHIADYINSHPLAAAVSNGDLGQLDTVSQALGKLSKDDQLNYIRGRIHPMLDLLDKVQEPVRPSQADIQSRWGNKPPDTLFQNIKDNLGLTWEQIQTTTRAFSDVNATAGDMAEGAARTAYEATTGVLFALPSAVAKVVGDAFERGSGGRIDSNEVQAALGIMGVFSGAGEAKIKLKDAHAAVDQIAGLGKVVKPYIDSGRIPPVGLHEIVDDAHKELAKQDNKDLQDLIKASEKSSTKEQVPELFDDFVKLKSDATINVSAEAVRKLYGDKVPTPDDNILGFVPHIAEQLAGAEQFGGRIEVPLSSWLAKVDPEVAKALKDNIAVRKGGMTLEETKLKPIERPAPIDSVDAIRRPAGLDPVATPEQVRLVRVPLSDEAGPNVHEFDFQDGEGKRIGGGSITESPDGKTLDVQTVAAGTTHGLPGFLGQRQVIGLLRQLQAEFPNAERIEGLRVSGARENPTPVSIPLRPTSAELTDFMRSGFEEQSIRDKNGDTKNIQPTYSTTVGESIPPETVAQVTDSPVMKAFGDKIHEMAKDTPIHVISREDMDNLYGPTFNGFYQRYEQGPGAIFLPSDISEWDPKRLLHIIMHEASHAATVEGIEGNFQLKTKVRLLMNEVNGYLSTNNDEARGAHSYAFKNEKEFIAEGQSKQGFQEALKSVPIPKELWKDLGAEPANAWEALKQIVKELWEKITGKEVPKNALDGLFKLSEEIETEQKKVLTQSRMETDAAPPKETQLELPGLTRVEDREAFEKATDIGMSAKRYKVYQEKIAQRDEEDMALFRAQAERKERARQTAEWKTEENRAREEAKTNLQGRPDIAADNLLREGSYLGEKLKGRVRLNSDLLSAEQKSGLPSDYMKSGGAHPDDIATMLGYHNPDAMLTALKQLHADRGDLGPKEHINKLAEKITQDHMTREFGNLEQNILEELKDHVISPTQFDILHEEILALATKNDGELPISKANLKAWVKRQFSDMPISVHRVDDYLAASGRADRGMILALEDGDFREALKFKEQQVKSLLMANEAKAYEKARASFDKLAKRLAKREITGLPQDYVAQIRDQLLRAQLPIGRSVQALAEDTAKGGSLMQFVQKISEDSQVPILLPDWMYDQNWSKKLDTMTAGEFSEYSKGIKQLNNFGRDEQKIIVGGEKIDHAEFMDKAKGQLETQSFNKKPVPYNPSKVGELVGKADNIFYGGLIQAESIFNRWDLGDKRGFFLSNFMYPAARAVNDLSARIKVYAKAVEEAAKPIDGLKMKQGLPNLLRKVTDGEPVNMTVENAIRIITDMGNESNKDKFIRGWKVEPQVLEAWLKAHTTKEMWDFAQNLGDVHEKMFGDLKDMIDSIGGVSPDRVELQPFIDPHGIQRRGWYSPMIYDQIELGKSRKLARLPAVDPNDVTGLTDTGYFKSTTATGAEIQRTGYAAPTDLTLDRLPQKMGQILYDTAMRPTVINLNKAFRDTDFLNAITKYSGVETRNLMRSWFRDIVGAGKAVSSESDTAMNQVGEYLRRNIVAQMVGWNLHTAQKHGLSALATSVAEVGVKDFAREFVGLLKASPDSMRNNWNYAKNMSEEIQRRDQHFVDSLGGQVESIKMGGPSWRDVILEKGSVIVSFADAVSARASWNAEFKKQMVEEARLHPDKTPDEYIGTARDIADSIVRRAHGSTALTSRPGFMRSSNSLVKSAVSLYSFFNQMLQRNYEATWRTKYAMENFKAGDKKKGWENLRRASWLYATSALWPALVEEMVTPYTNSDHDSWGKWTAKTLLNGMSSTIPFVREFVHAWLNGFEMESGIFASGMSELKKVADDLGQGARAMDAEHGGKTIKALTSVVGMATGLPNEVGNVMKTAWDSMHRSKETPKNVSETFRDATTGKAAGQPDILQRGIETVAQKGRRK